MVPADQGAEGRRKVKPSSSLNSGGGWHERTSRSGTLFQTTNITREGPHASPQNLKAATIPQAGQYHRFPVLTLLPKYVDASRGGRTNISTRGRDLLDRLHRPVGPTTLAQRHRGRRTIAGSGSPGRPFYDYAASGRHNTSGAGDLGAIRWDQPWAIRTSSDADDGHRENRTSERWLAFDHRR